MLGTESAVPGLVAMLGVPRAASAAGDDQRPSWRHHSAALFGPRLALPSASPPTGGFAEGWADAFGAGLALLPMGLAPDGSKVALVRYRNSRRAGRAACQRWASEKPGALLACRTALSGITVVDLDTKAPDLLRRVVARFGEPRIVVATPKGFHLYYAGGDHPRSCRDAPGFEGEPVDVRSGSVGDLLILPPSWTPKGRYTFHKGGWEDFGSLTPLAPGSLDKPRKGAVRATSKTTARAANGTKAVRTVDVLAGEVVPEGQRYFFLFGAARDLLTDAENKTPDLESLTAALAGFNESRCDPPASAGDVRKAAEGAWRLFQQGRCWPAYVTRPRPDKGGHVPERVKALGPAAAALWLVLRRANWNRVGGFRVVVDGLRPNMPEGFKNRVAVQKAKAALVAAGELVQLRRKFKRADGGWEAALFAFRDQTSRLNPISSQRTKTERDNGASLSRAAA